MNPALILEMLNTAKKNHGVPLAQIRWDLLFLNRPNFQIQSGIISVSIIDRSSGFNGGFTESDLGYIIYDAKMHIQNGIKPQEINSVEMVMSWVMVMDTILIAFHNVVQRSLLHHKSNDYHGQLNHHKLNPDLFL